MDLVIKKQQITFAGMPTDAWFIFDGDRKISQPFPSRATAKAALEAERLAEAAFLAAE